MKNVQSEYVGKNNCIWPYLCWGVFLFLLALIVASSKQMRYDESYTYVCYVQPFRFSELPSQLAYSLANNHLLNTFLVYIFDRATGIHFNEFVIRLPKLIFYAVYIFFAWLLAAQSRRYQLLTFVCFTANYMLFDLFTQARGYGMATALILCGIYFLDKWQKGQCEGDEDLSSLKLAACFFAFSVYANTIAFLVVAALVLGIWNELFRRGKVWIYLRQLKWWMTAWILFCLPALVFHLIVSRRGRPLFVSQAGFWKSILVGYGQTYIPEMSPVWWVIAGLIVLTTIVVFIRLKGTIFRTWSWTLIWVMYLAIIFIMEFIARKGYPTQRVLLPGLPLLLMSVRECFSLAAPPNCVKRMISGGVTLLLASMLVWQVFSKMRSVEPDYLDPTGLNVKRLIYQEMAGIRTAEENEELDWPKPFYRRQWWHYYAE